MQQQLGALEKQLLAHSSNNHRKIEITQLSTSCNCLHKLSCLRKEVFLGHSLEVYLGHSLEVFLGYSHEDFLGYSLEDFLGYSLDDFLGYSLEVFLGHSLVRCLCGDRNIGTGNITQCRKRESERTSEWRCCAVG